LAKYLSEFFKFNVRLNVRYPFTGARDCAPIRMVKKETSKT